MLEDDQTEILPEERDLVAVEITSILSPSHFYITLPFGKTPIDQLKKDDGNTTQTLSNRPFHKIYNTIE